MQAHTDEFTGYNDVLSQGVASKARQGNSQTNSKAAAGQLFAASSWPLVCVSIHGAQLLIIIILPSYFISGHQMAWNFVAAGTGMHATFLYRQSICD